MTGVRLGLLLQRFPNPEAPFGVLTPFAERVATLAVHEGVTLHAFGPEDLDPETGLLEAGRFDGPGRGWSFGEAPLPDVIWDRCFRRPRGLHLEPFRAQGALPVNSGWLDKWESHRLLAAEPDLRCHLPETALAGKAADIDDMLARYRLVYLKPVGGGAGRGIIRAARAGAGCLSLGYVSRETGDLREVFATWEQVDRWIRRQGGGQYIVQQGLNLSVWGGRPADVRVLAQKDGDGRWTITGMGARVAAEGRFTANLHTGGSGVAVEQLLEAVLPYDSGRRGSAAEALERLALIAARRIDRQVGPLGELGLDFGIDPAGQIWFIEQNFQPGRAIFAHLDRWDLFDLAHLRPVQYAKFLAQGKKTASAAPTAAT